MQRDHHPGPDGAHRLCYSHFAYKQCSVITTLAQMEQEARKWIALHNFLCRSYTEAGKLKRRYVEVMCADSPQQIRHESDRRLWAHNSVKVLTLPFS